MRVQLYFIFFIIYLTACAQNLGRNNLLSGNIKMHSYGQQLHFTCNKFRSTDFEGYVWDSACVSLYITRGPRNFFARTEDMYIQIYPFFVENEEIYYGDSVFIDTIAKSYGEDSREILGSSKIIDTEFVEGTLGLNSNSFFKNHFFEICNPGQEDWFGLQLTLYKRVKYEDNPSLVGITQFLVPPFLIHPEGFMGKFGNTAAAFHPLFNRFDASSPINYNRYATEMCRRISEL